jgi:hypothetical protein
VLNQVLSLHDEDAPEPDDEPEEGNNSNTSAARAAARSSKEACPSPFALTNSVGFPLDLYRESWMST